MSFKSSGSKTRPERVKPEESSVSMQDTPIPAEPSIMNPPSRRSSTSSSDSFHSAHNDPIFTSSSPPSKSTKSILRFTPSQENLQITASNSLKSEANTHFARGDFSSALSTYDRAIAELPVYLEYELAVLQSNIAACHIRLEEWREAVRAADKGWNGLETLDPTKHDDNEDSKAKEAKNEDTENEVVELPDSDEQADQILKHLELSDQRKEDIKRIRTKLLLRRAKARYMLGTTPKPVSTTTESKNPFAQAQSLTSTDDTSTTSAWSNLSSAQTDYTTLSSPMYFSSLPASDQKTVRGAMAVLPGLVEQAKEREMGEMMGKLKELGNGILRPFGLSTDMFKMEKDPVSGGMSLRFDGKK